MRIYDERAVLDGLPKGLARAVKIELFKDILLISPLFFGMNISTDVHTASENDNTSVREIAAVFAPA